MNSQTELETSKYPDIESKISNARTKTWDAVYAIAERIQVGMTEQDAIKVAQTVLVEQGVKKFWHKCHVRFGSQTVFSFNDPYNANTLKSEDIFYIDIGPVWGDIEGDAGATFVRGLSPEHRKIASDVKTIFNNVQKRWRDLKASGQDLYQFALEEANRYGWILAPSYVQGHRLSEFPHSFHSREKLAGLNFNPSPARWVLEIHICDPDLKFGAFYEDVLFH